MLFCSFVILLLPFYVIYTSFKDILYIKGKEIKGKNEGND